MPRVTLPMDMRVTILDAATRLMERYGYKKMTMEDIAQEAHIGKATIYGYFSSKEEVALSVLGRYSECVQARFLQIAGENALPVVRLRKMLVERIAFAFDIAQNYRQSLDETLAALRPQILTRREQQLESEARILALVLQEGLAEGIFACSDPLAAARTLLVAISGLMPTSLSPRELAGREEVIARTEQVVDLLLYGLVAYKRR